MVDIQHIECKNQQKTFSNRQNIVPYKAIGANELNFDVTHNCHQKLINSCFCALAVKIWLKVALDAADSPQFEEIVVAVYYRGNSFTVSFKADMILCMRKNSYVWSLTHGHTLFWGITQFILIVHHTNCSVNRQIGISDFKHVGKIRPHG